MRRLLVFASLIGCGTDTVDEPLPPDPVPHTTWYQDVGPIVATKCMGCHHDGGLAPFSLETYDDAAIYGLQMLAAVQSGQMPPWGATTAPDCAQSRSFKHDPRLTAAEMDTLQAWIDDDRPAGDFAQLSPAAEQHLTNTTHSLVPSTPFTTTGDTDQFMCFALDPQITASLMFMGGWEVVPGNPSVVHHAVVMTIDPTVMQGLTDAGKVGMALPCGEIPSNQIIGAWAPGQGPVEMPAGVAAVLTAGTGIAVQIHYHPAGNLNEPDATAINLTLTTERPTRLYAFGGWGNAHGAPQLQPDPDDTDGVHFLIPANNPNHAETMVFNIPDTATRTKMFTMQPHQHYIGTRLELRIHRADPQGEPEDECLVNSDWNFDWQRSYQYDVPIEELPTFGPGDQITVKCTYNNTLANPFVQRALADLHLSAPIDVHLGEQTTDEMCLGLVGNIVDVPQQ